MWVTEEVEGHSCKQRGTSQNADLHDDGRTTKVIHSGRMTPHIPPRLYPSSLFFAQPVRKIDFVRRLLEATRSMICAVDLRRTVEDFSPFVSRLQLEASFQVAAERSPQRSIKLQLAI